MHDERYRTVFAFPRMVEDLLRGFAAREWAAALDSSTLGKVPAEYVSDERLVHRGDTVWQVCVHDRGPIPAVVVYNGESPWTAPREAGELVQPVPGVLMPYRPSQRHRPHRRPPSGLHFRHETADGGSGPKPAVAPVTCTSSMRIANPIYDSTFKYLLQDETAARLLIGAILGEEVVSLRPHPTKYSVRVDADREADTAARPLPANLTVYRIDFAAVVETEAGERRQVLVEIQKAEYPEDIMRFRRYLGEHYAAPSNLVAGEADGSARCTSSPGRPRALPLTTIYFLGHRLAHTEATVLKVGREYVDAVTGERLREREEFVESLTHDSYVIQIPLLPDRRRNDLERLMGVFDQSRRTASRHFLEVDESELPAKYAPVLRRLLGAAGSREVRDAMIVEDEVVAHLVRKDRRIAEVVAERDEATAERDEATAERDEATAERDQALVDIAERDQAIAERDQAIVEHKETIAEREDTIRRQEIELAALRRRLDDE